MRYAAANKRVRFLFFCTYSLPHASESRRVTPAFGVQDPTEVACFIPANSGSQSYGRS